MCVAVCAGGGVLSSAACVLIRVRVGGAGGMWECGEHGARLHVHVCVYVCASVCEWARVVLHVNVDREQA